MKTLDDKSIDLETLWELSCFGGGIQWDSSLRNRSKESQKVLRSLLEQDFHLYGITTGFGQQADLRFSLDQESLLQSALVHFHGAGVGSVLSYPSSRGVFLARIRSVSRGYSGIRPELVDFMIRLFNAGVSPVIPELGSVGASGDLTPLSYLAALLAGEREGWLQGQRKPSAQILAELSEEPWIWQGKEALAILNGTGVMTGLAALAWVEVSHLADWVNGLTALGAAALGVPEEPYLPFLHRVKGHPGNEASADRIRQLAGLSDIPIGHPSAYETQEGRVIQPRYSFRCAPQVHGVLHDTLEFTGKIFARELNSANDNPLFDPEQNRAFHGGNFMGNHVSAAADYLRIALASSLNLVDRQVQLLLEGKGGLPINLARGEVGKPAFGLKALGITTSALAAEAQHLAAPVSVLSRPTEGGNQDVVSMGTISARTLAQQVRLYRYAVAHGLVVATQAWELSKDNKSPETLKKMQTWVRKRVPLTLENRPLGTYLENLARDLETTRLADIFL